MCTFLFIAKARVRMTDIGLHTINHVIGCRGRQALQQLLKLLQCRSGAARLQELGGLINLLMQIVFQRVARGARIPGIGCDGLLCGGANGLQRGGEANTLSFCAIDVDRRIGDDNLVATRVRDDRGQ